MNKLLRHFSRYRCGCAFTGHRGRGIVLSLAYGMVCPVGYSVSFDKTTFRLLRGRK